MPKLSYLPYYDQDGKNCEVDAILHTVQETLQCVMAMATFFPNNSEGCNFMQGYAGLIGASGVYDADLSLSVNKEIQQKIAKAPVSI